MKKFLSWAGIAFGLLAGLIAIALVCHLFQISSSSYPRLQPA